MRKEVNGGQSYWILFWICSNTQSYIFCLSHIYYSTKGFPSGSEGKETICNAGDIGRVGLIPGLRRSPGEGNGNPLQYSCLGNPMDRGAWLAVVHGVTKSWHDWAWARCCPAIPGLFPPSSDKITLWKALTTLELFNKPCLHLLLTFHLYKNA